MTEFWSDPANRIIQSSLKKVQYESQELRDKVGEASKVTWSNKNLRDEQSARKANHWKDPAYRTKTIEAQNIGKATLEFSEAQRYAKIGNKNPNFGTRWIHNNVLQQSKRILNTQKVPAEWSLGRKLYKKEQNVE